MKTTALLIPLAMLISCTQAQKPYNVSESSSKFAFDIYKQFAQEHDRNIFFSPLSLNTAMGMTYAGANGQTMEQMAKVFYFPLQDKELHAELGKLQDKLNKLSSKGVEISIANQLWADKQYKFIRAYTCGVKKAYRAPVKQMPFRVKPDDCRIEINKWVESKTNDRIKDLLPDGSITDLTALVLTNAVYFKGQWDSKFNTENTTDGFFLTSSKEKVECRMMNAQKKLNLYQGDDIKLLEMPYVGKEFSMLVLLPNEDISLSSVEKNLSLEKFKGYVDLMAESDVTLSFPKFKFDARYELKPILSAMGMPIAFSNAADFTRMSKKPDLKIDEVYHKAFVEVSEERTEAAAATAVVIVRKSFSVPVEFIANRSFMFFIRENETGNILFMGRVVNPVK